MMDRRRVLMGVGATCAAPNLPIAAARVSSPADVPAELSQRLSAIAATHRLAGAVVAVGRRGKLIGSWRHGHASLQHAVPVTNGTLFGAASVAKHITATGIMRLAQRNKVAIDAPVGNYLKIMPEGWQDRTIRSLLQHTSGLPDFTLAPKVAPGGEDLTRKQMMEKMRFRDPLFDNREGWSYCNSNYLLLGWIIEDVVGKPLSMALPDLVLLPAGALRARSDGPGVVTAGLAEPYVYDQRYWRIPFEQTDVAHGSGTLQWSAEDIAPWGNALLSNRIVSARSTADGLRWAQLSSGLELPYGFGFFLDRVAGRPIHWHNGGSPGTVAMFLQLPSDELSIGVMANTDTPSRTMRIIAWEAARAFAPSSTYLDRPAVPTDALDSRLAELSRTPGPLKPDPALIAPDFRRVLEDPTEQRRFNPGFRVGTRLERIEEYQVGSSTMRRYRVLTGDVVDYKLAGFDASGRLFWLWSC